MAAEAQGSDHTGSLSATPSVSCTSAEDPGVSSTCARTRRVIPSSLHPGSAFQLLPTPPAKGHEAFWWCRPETRSYPGISLNVSVLSAMIGEGRDSNGGSDDAPAH
jgi:hypothetical protein